MQTLEVDEWAALVRGFCLIEGVIQFIIGDLIAYGGMEYDSRTFNNVLRMTGRTTKTLKNWAGVCLAIPPEERTYDLNFGHYDAVVSLGREQREEVLYRAFSNKWTIPRTRQEVRTGYSTKVDENRFGKPLNLEGLGYAPINEQGVVFLFGLLCHRLGFLVEAVRKEFPDCIAKRRVESRRTEEWETVRIEFEFTSSEFKRHHHDPKGCDLIVCWIDDWKDCPLEVLELESWVAHNESGMT